MFDRNGRIVRWYNLITDIDDRKRAEEALRASEINFRRIVESIPGMVGTVTATGELEQNQDDKHLKASLEHYQRTRKGLDELAIPSSSDKPIHPQYVVKILDELAAEDAVFTCDVGTPTVWAARYLRMNRQAAIVGLIQSRVNGKRLTASYRSASQPSGSSGGDAFGRRRTGDADGRPAFVATVKDAGRVDEIVDLTKINLFR